MHSKLGTEEQNNTIDFGECVMALGTLKTAKNIAQAKRSGMPMGEIESKFDRKRAQILMFIYFVDVVPEALHWYFINKVVGLKPLVELHKEHGDALQPALERLYKQKKDQNNSKSLRVTKVEINALLNNETTKTPPKLDAVAPAPEHKCLNPEAGISSVQKIRAVLNECAEFNQDLSSGVTIKGEDVAKILLQLDLIEQCFDEQTESPLEQGDPTDQSVGSYAHATMVDDSTPDEHIEFFNEFHFPSEEDYSQDPNDYH